MSDFGDGAEVAIGAIDLFVDPRKMGGNAHQGEDQFDELRRALRVRLALNRVGSAASAATRRRRRDRSR